LLAREDRKAGTGRTTGLPFLPGVKQHPRQWAVPEIRPKLPGNHSSFFFRILLHQFTSPLIYILLLVGVVTILLRVYTDP